MSHGTASSVKPASRHEDMSFIIPRWFREDRSNMPVRSVMREGESKGQDGLVWATCWRSIRSSAFCQSATDWPALWSPLRAEPRTDRP